MKKVLMMVFLMLNCAICFAQSNYEKIAQLMPQAEQGDLDAQNKIGFYYYGVRDYNHAFLWWKKAAEQGYASSESWLGTCYKYGWGTTKNLQLAFVWFEKAAIQNHCGGMRELADCYYYGLGCIQNYSKAFELYKKSAEQEDCGAVYQLAICYENGIGVIKNIDEAIVWYQKSVDICRSTDAAEKIKKLRPDSPTPHNYAKIEFLSDSKSSLTSYNLRAGIKSSSKITNVSVTVNNSRGINVVLNDGYDFTLNKNLTLNYGNNTITVSVTNSSGTTSKSFNVDVSANNNNYKTVSEKRVALVIGNSNYQNSPLKNPVNDATDMAAKLRSLGFQVTFKTDLSLSGFEYALRNFKSQASNADIALLYYAGHGMEIDGRNYLIPVDAPFGDQLKYKSVDANYALDMISGSNKKIIILDACRNNPGRSINDGGLAPMSARNAFFAYSTSPGKTAPDGYGRNSPYTSALLTALSYKNLTLPQLFQEVSKIVTSKTQYQIPWTSSSLVDDVILNKN